MCSTCLCTVRTLAPRIMPMSGSFFPARSSRALQLTRRKAKSDQRAWPRRRPVLLQDEHLQVGSTRFREAPDHERRVGAA